MARSCHWLGVECKQFNEHNILECSVGDLKETLSYHLILFIANIDICRLPNIEGV